MSILGPGIQIKNFASGTVTIESNNELGIQIIVISGIQINAHLPTCEEDIFVFNCT